MTVKTLTIDGKLVSAREDETLRVLSVSMRNWAAAPCDAPAGRG